MRWIGRRLETKAGGGGGPTLYSDVADNTVTPRQARDILSMCLVDGQLKRASARRIGFPLTGGGRPLDP